MNSERVGEIGSMRLEFSSGTTATGGVFSLGADQPLRFVGFCWPPGREPFSLEAALPRLRDLPLPPKPQRGRLVDLAAHIGLWCACRHAEVLRGLSASRAREWVADRACNVWEVQGATDANAVRRSERIAEKRCLAKRPFFAREADGSIVVFDDPTLLANAVPHQVLRGPAWVWTPDEARAIYGAAIVDLQAIVKCIK